MTRRGIRRKTISHRCGRLDLYVIRFCGSARHSFLWNSTQQERSSVADVRHERTSGNGSLSHITMDGISFSTAEKEIYHHCVVFPIIRRPNLRVPLGSVFSFRHLSLPPLLCSYAVHFDLTGLLLRLAAGDPRTSCLPI